MTVIEIAAGVFAGGALTVLLNQGLNLIQRGGKYAQVGVLAMLLALMGGMTFVWVAASLA